MNRLLSLRGRKFLFRGISNVTFLGKRAARMRRAGRNVPEVSFLREPAGQNAGTARHLSFRTEEMLRLETLLFLSREPLGAKKLAQFLGVKESKTVTEWIDRLNRFYDDHRYVFRVLDFAGGYQLRIRPQFTPWLRRLCHHDGHEGVESPEIHLSPPAIETLAIIAYRQPIVRAEIETIRGVQCGEILRVLLGRDLIRIAGRSDELGRPFLYETTRKFLEIFGLKSLAQLPRIEHTES